MLKQRIATALVLLALLAVALTVARPWGFPAFALLLVSITIGEWLALLGLSRLTTVVVAGVMAFVLWMVETTPYAPRIELFVWGLAAVVWIVLAATLFSTGTFPKTERLRFAHVLLALLLPAACWFGLVAAYRHGLVFLISVLAVVWAADIAAYFAGRAFGKRKLAPAISPGKTWAGAVGGAVATVALAWIAIETPALSGSFVAVLHARWPVVVVLAAVLLLVVLSVVGDLYESLLKRRHGVKDSGRVLPGHGGVFDRVDALLPVVPITLLMTLFP